MKEGWTEASLIYPCSIGREADAWNPKVTIVLSGRVLIGTSSLKGQVTPPFW